MIAGTSPDVDLVLTDPSVSRRHASFEVHTEGVLVTDLESRNGTYLAGRKITSALVTPGGVVRLGRTRVRVLAKDESLHIEEAGAASFGRFLTASAPLRKTLARLDLVAKTDVTVLLEGEAGTGKRAIARAIHDRSDRAAAAFLVIDAAHEELEGAIVKAKGGTLVFSALVGLSAALQDRILEALEQHRGQLRFIFLEHRDLEERMRAGEILEELYYRVAVVRAKIPPLRDRPLDLALLARSFAGKTPLSAEALRSLSLYDWPGNAGELESVIERAAAFAGDREIGPNDLLPEAIERGPRPFHQAKEEIILEFERRYVRALLFRHEGNISGAARDAGLSRGAFYALMKRCGIES